MYPHCCAHHMRRHTNCKAEITFAPIDLGMLITLHWHISSGSQISVWTFLRFKCDAEIMLVTCSVADKIQHVNRDNCSWESFRILMALWRHLPSPSSRTPGKNAPLTACQEYTVYIRRQGGSSAQDYIPSMRSCTSGSGGAQMHRQWLDTAGADQWRP